VNLGRLMQVKPSWYLAGALSNEGQLCEKGRRVHVGFDGAQK
jgi:hypothetical protein